MTKKAIITKPKICKHKFIPNGTTSQMVPGGPMDDRYMLTVSSAVCQKCGEIVFKEKSS